METRHKLFPVGMNVYLLLPERTYIAFCPDCHNMVGHEIGEHPKKNGTMICPVCLKKFKYKIERKLPDEESDN